MKSISNTHIAVVFALVVTGLVALSLEIPFFETKELQTSDQMMNLRYHLQHRMGSKPDPHLVFAAIDERSVRELGEAWPFPRYIHGGFLNVLSKAEPKAVGWDIFFTEERNNPIPVAPTPAAPTPTPDASTTAPAPESAPAPEPPPTEDEVLVAGAARLPHLITAAARGDSMTELSDADLLPTRPLKNVVGDTSQLLSAQSALLPFPALRKASYFGFADEEASGGIRRTMPLVVNIGGKVLPSLDLEILLQYWDVDPDKVVVDLGRAISIPQADGTITRIPIDAKGSMIINYRARVEDFQGMSYAGMGKGLLDLASNQASKEREQLPPLKDSLVVVGVTIAGTDAGITPLDTNKPSPNVGTHLNVLNNILQNDYVRPVSGWIWMPLYALLVFGAGNLMLRVGLAPMLPIGLFAMALVAAASFAALWYGNWQVPVAMPEIGLLILAGAVPSKRFFGEEREKIRLKNAMRACLSEKIMVKMLEHPDNVKLGGTKQEITVMFCDIRGFTKYCDNRDSAEVMDVLNDYMEAMTQVVFKYDGTVDKYIGDCIMAFWNAPQPQPDHAQRAVCCAMEMRYALATFKTKRAGIDIELFECGIGIHTGEALVGMMGSSIKRNYTAMGSTVNMGARLETLTKRLNERILISQETLDQLQGDFPITDRGEATVPGFAKPIHVYAVGADQDITSALKVGRTLATQQDYTAEEVDKPIWAPAPLPQDADPNP